MKLLYNELMMLIAGAGFSAPVVLSSENKIKTCSLFSDESTK